jgi:head-tail adaptor
MTLSALLTHTVEVRSLTLGAEDEFGNATETWGAWTSYSGRVEPISASEDVVDRDTQIGDHQVFLPHDAVITGRSQVRYDSITFEVLGPPQHYTYPRGPSHIVARIRSVDGT